MSFWKAWRCYRPGPWCNPFPHSLSVDDGSLVLVYVAANGVEFLRQGVGEGSTSDPSPPPLAHCKPENRSLAGPFSLGAKGVCRDVPPCGDWPTARDRSPNVHRLLPPAPRSRRDGFKTPIDFNELAGWHCARVSLVPACLKADGEATRAAWSLVCLGSFAQSFRGTVEIEKFRGATGVEGGARDQGRLSGQALSRLLRDHEPSPGICLFGIPLKPCKDVPRVL